MKQKQIKQVANATKAIKKRAPAMKFKKDDGGSVKEDKVAIKKNFGNKIPTKIQKKVIVEETSEDDEEDIDESGEVVDNDDGDDMDSSDEEADEKQVEDDDEIEEEMEDTDENQEEEMDDGEPSETAIAKEEPTEVKNGYISKIVRVEHLKKQCHRIDIFEVFAQYGAIDKIDLQTSRFGTVADVAFKTENAAKAALDANKTVKVCGSLITVTKRIPTKQEMSNSKTESAKVGTFEDNCPRTVYVTRFGKDTTEDQIKEHFVSCGEIDHVNLENKRIFGYAFVTFMDESSKVNAIKLHNTILNGFTIGVYKNLKDSKKSRDPKRTVVIKIKQNFKEAHKLEDIFSKCGEIEHLDIYSNNDTAVLIFKTNEAVEEALKLSGKTVQGIELDLHKYQEGSKNAIHVTNLAKSVTEEDLRELFSTAGEIVSIFLKPGYAVIHFKDSDSFCKSFLLNESLIKNQMIFIEPQSSFKRGQKRYLNERQGFKHPGQNGKFTAKRRKYAY